MSFNVLRDATPKIDHKIVLWLAGQSLPRRSSLVRQPCNMTRLERWAPRVYVSLEVNPGGLLLRDDPVPVLPSARTTEHPTRSFPIVRF